MNLILVNVKVEQKQVYLKIKTMTNEQFIYWLKGFLEAKENKLSDKDFELIKNNLNNILSYTYYPYTLPYTIYCNSVNCNNPYCSCKITTISFTD